MKSRRELLLLTAGAAGLAGCSGDEGSPSTDTPTDTETETATDTPEPADTETATEEPTEVAEDRTGEEIYSDWINGENGEILEQADEEISFEAVDKALEEGFEQGGINQAVANALETASQDYIEGSATYEERHRTILSALHQKLEEKDGEQWNFDIFSNINYTQTVGDTIQYSEIKVETGETTESGEDEYAIINAALTREMNHATHIPGEDKGKAGYKRTMSGVRESHNDTDLPPHDVEALEKRGEESGLGEEVAHSFLPAMGYQLFAGGHSVDTRVEYNPDEMLVPASKEIHKKIDEIGYEQGDQMAVDRVYTDEDEEGVSKLEETGEVLGTHGRMDLQLAINERYFNEGYDEVDGPVVIDNLEVRVYPEDATAGAA